MKRAVTILAAVGTSMALLTAPMAQASVNTAKQPTAIVVMGDSVASGFGLPTTNSPINQACGRSGLAYGLLIGRGAGRPAYIVACSGASSINLVKSQRVTAPNGVTYTMPSQIEQAKRLGRPIIYETNRANGLFWKKFSGACLANKCATPAMRIAFNAAYARELGVHFASAIAVERQLRPACYIMSGYYDPFGGPAAAAQLGMNAKNIARYRAWLDQLNNGIASEVRQLNKTYRNAIFAPMPALGPNELFTDSRRAGHPNDKGHDRIARHLYQYAWC